MFKILTIVLAVFFSISAHAGRHCYAIHYKSAEGDTITKFQAFVDIDWCSGKEKNWNDRYEVYLKYYSDNFSSRRILRYKGVQQSTGEHIEKWDTPLTPLQSFYSSRAEPNTVLKTYLLYDINRGRKKYRWISTKSGLIK